MKSPFKFLEAYSKDDKSIFFGRDKEIEQIYTKLFDSNLILIYGASGTGKTSIINCGIANEFENTDWFPLYVRRKDNIIVSLMTEIDKLSITNVPTSHSLVDAIESLYLDYFKPVYIIFDQFEELFIFGDDDERKSCIDFLSSLLKDAYNIKVIIIVREEYLAYFNIFEKGIPTFFDNRFRVEHMTLNKAEEVIRETCKEVGILLENDDTPKLILQNISAQKIGVELTYLQVYLDRLFDIYIENNPQAEAIVFSNDLVNTVGNINDVLVLFLEEQIKKLEDADLAWNILKAFITSGGTKRTTSLNMVKEFMDEGSYPVSIETINSYTQKFVELKIIKYLEDNKSFEITHDSLAAKIWEKVSAEEKGIIDVHTFITSAYIDYKKRNARLSKRNIAYINPFLDKINLSEEELRFINKTKSFYRREKLILSSLVFFIFLMLLGGIFYANNSKNKAEYQEEKASAALEMLKIETKRKEALENEKLFNDAASFIKGGYYENANDKIKEIFSKNPSQEMMNRINLLKATMNEKNTTN